MEEKTTKSRQIHKGKIINLRVDEVVLPDGRKAIREIVEHRGAVAAVPLLPGERVILIKQFRKAVEEVIYEIPAGKLEEEEGPRSCIERELKEEIGCQAGALKKLLSYYPSPGFSSELIHLFLATDLEKKKQDLESDEFIETVTLEFNEALKMIEQGRIKDGKTIIGLFLARQFL
ncbi:NUDIX hydrolase [candidate division NPL-UPA2 bacterium]|nr:NUDIX hydrolase [candidate division NPL-UPA2 bacterium]